MKTNPHCLTCGQPISWGVHVFSYRIYGYSLCLKDQCRMEESGASGHVVDLYLALKSRNFPVELGYNDGFNRADIVLPDLLFIEITDPLQSDQDQKKNNLSQNSHRKNIPSIVIPGFMLEDRRSFEHAVNEISKVCRMLMKTPVFVTFIPPYSAVQLQ